MVYAEGPAGESNLEQGGPESLIIARDDFWADTCRETGRMRHPCHEIVELYRKFGCRFCEPGLQQVQYVLGALDGAAPGWDKDHPELFYQTLELNFPELVRRA